MIDNNEKNTIELAFCIDDNFAVHLFILLQSIKCNLRKGVNANCNILGELTNASKQQLKKVCSDDFDLTFYGKIDGLDGLHISEHFKERLSIVTYYRLVLPQILSHKNKVIYLDSDMIVLDDIAKLWNIDLNGFSTAVVEDCVLQKEQRYVFLKLAFNRYFNAGLLVMDLAVWREKELTNKAITNIKLNPDYEYNDQDGLNVVLDGDCYYLDNVWNAQTPLLLANQCSIRPKIVHFTGQEKPWHISSLHPNTKDYLFYKNKTPFKNAPLDYFLDSEDHLLLKELTDKFPKGCRLAVYGCGNRGRRIIDYITNKLTAYEISFVVDKNAGETYRTLPIFAICPNQKIDVLLIASIPFRDEIITSLPVDVVEQEMIII